MCLCFPGQSLPWKDKILFPSRVFSIHIPLYLWNIMFWGCLLPSDFSIHPVAGCSHKMQSAVKWDKINQCLNLLFCISTRDVNFVFFSCMLMLLSCCISLATALHVRVVSAGLQSKPHFLSFIDANQLFPAQLGERSTFLAGRKQNYFMLENPINIIWMTH